jgi:DNA-binding NarL/FixJ family response regulator
VVQAQANSAGNPKKYMYKSIVSKVLQGKIYVSPEFGEQLILKAVQSAEAGTRSTVDLLSDRELEVMQLLDKGGSSRSIAETLHLSVKTIETHRAHIKEKLGFQESEEMVKFAIDWVAQQTGA